MCLQILGVLDLGRDAWINREDWIQNGVHVGSNRKYKDSYYLQAQAMCYMNSWKVIFKFEIATTKFID
jgi:actin-related protein 8